MMILKRKYDSSIFSIFDRNFIHDAINNIVATRPYTNQNLTYKSKDTVCFEWSEILIPVAGPDRNSKKIRPMLFPE